MERSIRDYDPALGCALQGDVVIIPIPDSVTAAFGAEIPARDRGRLVLMEGEVTGHHHEILLPKYRAADDLMADALAGAIPVPTARLHTVGGVAAAMVSAGILTRADLATAVLVIEVGPMVLVHPEHDGIRIPPGRYLIGRQVESAGAEERRVQD